MEKSFNLEITSLDGNIWDGECFGASIPTSKGEVTVLANHTPLISDVLHGELKIKVEKGKGIYSDEYIFVAVGRGFLEVKPEKTTVLVRNATRVDDIDEQEALEAKEKAEKLLKDYKDGKSDVGFADVTAQLERALASLKVIKRKRKYH